MARYNIAVKIYETKEPIIRTAEDDFNSRITELTAQGKLSLTDKFYENMEYSGDISDYQHHISQFIDLIRKRAQYPYITGTVSLTAL